MLRPVLFILLLVNLYGCSFVATYNPSFAGESLTVNTRLPGKALIYNLDVEDQYVFSGNPTSFTGSATTLNIQLGEITRRLATKAFGDIFIGGAEYANSLDNIGKYTIVVKPKTTNYSYAYNQLKNAGFAVTPQVDIGLDVEVLSARGDSIFEKSYSSGLTDGKSYFMSGSPGEEVSKATHIVLSELLNRAALDTYNILSKQAMTHNN